MLDDGDPFTIHYGALELTDYICCWSVFGHHTVVAVKYYFAEIVTSSTSSTKFVASLSLSLPVDLSA